MDPASPERLQLLKERYPGMDLEMVQFFARTMTAVHDITSMMEAYFTRFGLSKGRFMVMVQLLQETDHQGVNISDILSWYRVSSATMTGLIDTLEKEGMIERIRSPQDRRRVNIRITPAGRDFMDEFLPRHHRYLGAFTSTLNDRERRTLAELMAKLHRSIADGVEMDLDEEGGSR